MSDVKDINSWKQLAEQLHECNGIAQRRAQVVALVATGRTHEETKGMLSYSSISSTSNHIGRYRNQSPPEAEWLTKHGPEL